MSNRFVFEAKIGTGRKMSARDRDEAWEELRRMVGAGGPSKPKPKDFWEDWFGDDGDGLFYDGEGNDRTEIVKALVERLDQTTRQVLALAERVNVLERIAVQDEARIALEIEKLRSGGGDKI